MDISNFFSPCIADRRDCVCEHNVEDHLCHIGRVRCAFGRFPSEETLILEAKERETAEVVLMKEKHNVDLNNNQ